jgi:hypothetical protein
MIMLPFAAIADMARLFIFHAPSLQMGMMCDLRQTTDLQRITVGQRLSKEGGIVKRADHQRRRRAYWRIVNISCVNG